MVIKSGRYRSQHGKFQVIRIAYFVFMAQKICNVFGSEFCDAPLLNHDFSFYDSMCNSHMDKYRQSDDYRLPNTTRPIAYTLWIDLNITHFQGKVSIELEATEAGDRIVMHAARQLAIESVALVKSSDKTEIPLQDHRTDAVHQFLILQTVDGQLMKGEKYIVAINYFGELNTKGNYGFVRSSYTDSEEKDVWFAYTNLSPTYARILFPCYDEPGLKAIFQISIEHDCDYNAISNMPETLTTLSRYKCKTEFDQSPLMSTYLISIFVSEFEFVENYEGPIQPGRIKHRVFRPRIDEFINKTQAPLEASQKLMTEMEEYFGQKYSLPKIDHIGIAMNSALEYWGIINYRSELLYFKSPNTVQEQRNVMNVVDTIAHELSHQWFGNLVTPANWNYLWLSEGVADYFGKYFSLNYFNAIESGQIPYVCAGTMRMDAKIGTVAMTSSHKYSSRCINDQKESFVPIYYDKAACVISMLHAILGDRFKPALTNYLAERKFNTVTPDNLANEFNKVAHEAPALIPNDVHFKTILDTWHSQEGLPIIHVDYDLKTSALTITQKRYTTYPVKRYDKSIWSIHLDFSFASNVRLNQTDGIQEWLNNPSQTFKPTEARNWTGEQWILINKKMGYYRVNYNKENWQALSVALRSGHINSLNRAQLIDDAFEFAAQNILSYDVAMSLLSYIPILGETDCFVWTIVNDRLEDIYKKFRGSENINNFVKFVRKLTASIFHKFGINEEANEHITTMCTRKNVIKWACRSGLESCLILTANALSDHVNGIHVLQPHILDTILLEGVRHLDQKTYFEIWKNISTIESYGIPRQHILRALGNTGDQSLLKYYLNSSIASSHEGNPLYSAVDRSLMILSVMETQLDGPTIVIKFLETKRNRIIKLIDNELSKIFGALSELIKTELNKFKFQQLLKLFNQSDNFVTNIDKSIKWLDGNGAIIDQWLIDEDRDAITKTNCNCGREKASNATNVEEKGKYDSQSNMSEENNIEIWSIVLFGILFTSLICVGLIIVLRLKYIHYYHTVRNNEDKSRKEAPLLFNTQQTKFSDYNANGLRIRTLRNNEAQQTTFSDYNASGLRIRKVSTGY